MRKRIAAGLVSAGVALACGPSYQALYEGDARFEHCYALEETTAAMQARGDCWRDWILHYTYGQTRDRVDYASTRYRALTRAPESPTDEAMMEAAPGEGRAQSIAAPAPTSAYAPPPKTLAEVDGGGAGELPGYASGSTPAPEPVHEATPPPSAPPGGDCSTQCQLAWNRCKDKCVGACDDCAKGYKKCMRACFK
jgi:hypothetical protein